MLDEVGGYSYNVSRGVLPGWRNPGPSDEFWAPYYGYMGTQNTNESQERIAEKTLGAQQNTLQSLLPSLMGIIGGFGAGGGGYQTDYGAGIKPQQPQQAGRQQQMFRGYAQPQQQQQQGGGLQALMAALAQYAQ